jgi:hypothetical protein
LDDVGLSAAPALLELPGDLGVVSWRAWRSDQRNRAWGLLEGHAARTRARLQIWTV